MTKARLDRTINACLKYINQTPELLSLLFDLDLLPEQLAKNTPEWKQMLILTAWHHRRRRKLNHVKQTYATYGK